MRDALLLALTAFVWISGNMVARAQTNEQRTLIVMVGAPGEEDYGARFAEWGGRWEKAGQAGGVKTVVIGTGAGTNDTARLQQALAQQAAAAKSGDSRDSINRIINRQAKEQLEIQLHNEGTLNINDHLP